MLRENFAYPDEALREVQERIEHITHPVAPKETLDIIKTDPDDNRILECAAAAQSDYIVTGDKRHILPLGSFRGKPIMKVADFLHQLQGASRER